MTCREDELLAAARNAMKNAYAPYSRFAVGAAVRLTDGSIVVGSNFENVSYGLSICAETVALASANAQGRLADVEALAVAGGIIQPDGSISGHDPVRPCGRCRQILHEAEHAAERPISIYCASAEDGPVERHSVAELLPYPFGPSDLGIKASQIGMEPQAKDA
ncbi:MAG TPA: cytidine deaminase [Rhizorhapis sp.]